MFPSFLAASFGLRIVWIALVGVADPRAQDDNADMAVFFVNKIAFATFFTAFSFVVARLTSLRSLLVKRSQIKRDAISRGWFIFLSTNVVAYVACATLIVLRVLLPEDCGEKGDAPNRGRCFHYGVVIFSCGYLLLGFFFAMFVASTARSVPCNPHQRRFLRRLLVVTSILVIVFAMRFVVFVYEPITGAYLPKPMYPYMFYEIPELVSGWILLVAMSMSVKETRPTLLSLLSQHNRRNCKHGVV